MNSSFSPMFNQADGHTAELLVSEARKIGYQILGEAIELRDGSLTWGRGVGRRREPMLDSGLYNGRCGEAMFFAALYAATGESTFHEASRRALLGLVRGLESKRDAQRLVYDLRLGITGIGGILYALVQVARLLEQSELLEHACLLSEALSAERIRHDPLLDIVWGSAGALLGLIVLADSGAEAALGRAYDCATRLLEKRVIDSSSGFRAWPNERGDPVAGFAHGSSGIAHALLQLHYRMGNPIFREAALDAFAFERTIFSDATMSWPDTRYDPEDGPVKCSWCHGAVGIGFSRLSALMSLNPQEESAIASDLLKALKSTIMHKSPNDNICCGNLGRADFMIETGRKLENASLRQLAVVQARECIQRAHQDGFSISKNLNEAEAHFNPGFWQGITGIGYTLLRLTDPNLYPCVLTLDSGLAPKNEFCTQ